MKVGDLVGWLADPSVFGLVVEITPRNVTKKQCIKVMFPRSIMPWWMKEKNGLYNIPIDHVKLVEL